MPDHKPTRLLAAALILLAGWIVHGFADALLAAGVTAVASWPLYERFRARLPRRVGAGAAATLFTVAMSVLVLAPLLFSTAALLGEARLLLVDIALADGKGLPAPPRLLGLPIVGPWLDEHWQSGALHMLAQRAEPSTLLGWMQILGQFTARQALIVAFAILLLGFFYRDGAVLACELTHALRRFIGEQAERYVDVATRAVRASATSMLAVALFDTLAAALAYSLAGAPRALVWAAITGSLAAVPFLGYAAVAALAMQLTVKGAATPALLSLALGCTVLLLGDKVLRPMVARGGIRLPFVWVLMGCIGGFSVLGPAGLVIGPLALALAREAWEHPSGAAER
jgi:predicted PurR-regulated permease PerM